MAGHKRKRPQDDAPLTSEAAVAESLAAVTTAKVSTSLPTGAPAGGGKKGKSGGFQSLGLSPDVLRAILRMGAWR